MNMHQFTHFRKKSYHLIRNFGLANVFNHLFMREHSRLFKPYWQGKNPSVKLTKQKNSIIQELVNKIIQIIVLSKIKESTKTVL